jgi:hypothetical protein
MARLREPSTERSRKPNLWMEQRALKLPTDGSNNQPFNLLEGYFNIPERIIDALKHDLVRMKAEDLQKKTHSSTSFTH